VRKLPVAHQLANAYPPRDQYKDAIARALCLA